MVRSMTGFGIADAENTVKKITVELRAVNNRYLEVVTRMPKSICVLEDRIKKAVGEQISRGRVEVSITLEEQDDGGKLVKLDEKLALCYYEQLKRLAVICGKQQAEVQLMELASMPGIFTLERPEDDLDELWELLESALRQALIQMVAMRELEGEKLSADLLARRQTICEWLGEIELQAPLVVCDYKQRMAQRISELTADGCSFDEGRLAAEVAMFADKASITEEIIRLHSHLQQLQDMLISNGVVGRKLDFLLQELNREVNTIGAKANDLKISRLVIDTKAELEKIREQVQNIE